MKKILILLAFLLGACSPTSSPTPTPVPPTIQPATVTISPNTPTSVQPTVTQLPTGEVVSQPSYQAAAFYYPWYGNPTVDGQWIHWNQNGRRPPQDIGSDYFPVLGAYSSNDPKVVAQHMEWLKQAGVGVIITSWWGQGTYEDRAVPLLLETADRYGLKVALHIEPYGGRTVDSLVRDVKYIYKKYGDSPAFFRSTASTRYSPGDQPKGMFFVWCIEFAVQECGKQRVEADYWRPALDAIHALPEGGLVIANTLQGSWVTGGHFDGLYNYATLHLEQEGGFNWARSLPPDSLYIPSMIPGFSARRVGYSEDTYVERRDGATYNEQWTAALGTGVEPTMVTVTSFNEWHEGAIIEPAAIGATDGKGNAYTDFGSLPPEGYLTLTRDWIQKFLVTTFPAAYRARLEISTTSDWTTVNIASGGAWIRPERISASDTVTTADMEAGDRFALLQSLDDASAGKKVQMVWDVLLTNLDPSGILKLQIDRGDIGFTIVTIYNYIGATPVPIKTFKWDGITTGRNSRFVEIPIAELTALSP